MTSRASCSFREREREKVKMKKKKLASCLQV